VSPQHVGDGLVPSVLDDSVEVLHPPTPGARDCRCCVPVLLFEYKYKDKHSIAFKNLGKRVERSSTRSLCSTVGKECGWFQVLEYEGRHDKSKSGDGTALTIVFIAVAVCITSIAMLVIIPPLGFLMCYFFILFISCAGGAYMRLTKRKD